MAVKTSRKNSTRSRRASSSRRAASSRKTASTRKASARASTHRSTASSRDAKHRKKTAAPRSRAHPKSNGLAHTTMDHEEIRRWAEERGARPACVKGTERGDTCLLRLDFPGYSGEESLQPVSWDQWFKTFDQNNLALVYQEKTAGGQQSNFNKLVNRRASR